MINKGPLSNEAIKAIYTQIMSASIALQKETLIGYLGPPGTFTHQVKNKKDSSYDRPR